MKINYSVFYETVNRNSRIIHDVLTEEEICVAIKHKEFLSTINGIPVKLSSVRIENIEI